MYHVVRDTIHSRPDKTAHAKKNPTNLVLNFRKFDGKSSVNMGQWAVRRGEPTTGTLMQRKIFENGH
jgi:hypothetical protein